MKDNTINPAIAYSIVKDMIVDKEDSESMKTWNCLYRLSLEECIHKDIDGSSAWVKPYEHIDYKFCKYCSSN